MVANATMREFGAIEGTIAGEGQAVTGSALCVYELDETQVGCLAPAEGTTSYRYGYLPEGPYRVKFTAPGYKAEWSGGATDFAHAATVEVEDETVTPLSADLEIPPGISGLVTRTVSGDPVESGQACAVAPQVELTCGTIEEDGEYWIPVGSGTYTVDSARRPRPPVVGWRRSEAAATPVVVGSQPVIGIDAVVDPTGELYGRIVGVGAPGNGSLPDTEVCARRGDGAEICALSEERGYYRMKYLRPGPYTVRFRHPGYATQYWERKERVAEAVSVAIVQGHQFRANALLAAAVAPADATAPQVSGVGKVGGTLTCGEGAWTGVPMVFAYEYSWLRDRSPIAGAQASTYSPGAADAGASVSCEVAAINDGGTSAPVASSNSIAIAALVTEPVDNGGSGDGGGGASGDDSPAPPPAPAPLAPLPPAAAAPAAKQSLRCKKGFRKVRRKGKARCVKVKVKTEGKRR